MTERIIDYQIVALRLTDAFNMKKETGGNKPTLAFDELINIKIERGWQPLGPPFLILDEKWQQINQTMVKYANPLDVFLEEHGYELTEDNKE